MNGTESSILLEGLILIEEGADPAVDRIVRDNGRVRRTVVFVSDPYEAVNVAVEMANNGVELIELDGGFGSIWAAKIFNAIDGRAPVGFVTFGIESMEGVADFKQRYEQQIS